MVSTQKQVRRQALKLSLAAFGLSICGAVVVAAPFALTPKMAIAGMTNMTGVSLAPLGDGPSIQLARATGDDAGDCVRVTRLTGPDGKVYATRGMVCSGDQ